VADDFGAAKAFRIPVIMGVFMALIFFVPAGSLSFAAGWGYWAVTTGFLIFFTIYFLRKDPALLARRNQVKEREPQAAGLRLLSILWALGFLIPGFDYRYHWSSVPTWLAILSLILVAVGYLIIFSVFRANTFASTIVQVEQEQRVITTGPYAWVRHPMYSGLILTSLFTPFALGSYWAFLTFILIIPTLVYRIKGEEKLLLSDLPGYEEFCTKTRHRLIPLVW